MNQYAGLKTSCIFCNQIGAIDGTQMMGVNQNHIFKKIVTNSFISLKNTLKIENVRPIASANICCKKKTNRIKTNKLNDKLPFKNVLYSKINNEIETAKVNDSDKTM